jgi:tRNA A-37 threonylcarbamoyl transferase component Bud32
MSSRLENALMLLGLESADDPATLWQNYTDRLAVLQHKLINAETLEAQEAAQQDLARLVGAYQMARSATEPATRQVSRSSGMGREMVNREAVTMMRSADDEDVLPEPQTYQTQSHQGSNVVIGPGVVLQGRYEIQAVLGDGGMGRVFAARDRLKDEEVAIKVLRNELLSSAAARGRFLSEAKVSCKLAHPNIVRVFDVGVASGRYFFTMERLRGMSLRRRMQSQLATGRPFPVEEAVQIGEQLLEALRHAHRFIVHRDLKPENVWVDNSGVVKLMDFGIARAYQHNDLTRTGMNLGTAYYMAPEQHADAKEVDWRADQYAWGVLMYELLTGRVPMGAVQPIEKMRNDIPKQVSRAVMRSMSPRPDSRFDSLKELQSRIVLRREEDVPGALFNAFGRSIALGTIAGAIFAYFDSLSMGRIHEWMYPSGIAVGIGTAMMVEFCETFFRSRYRSHVIAAFSATVIWIALVLIVAQKLSGLSNGLVMMLCGSVWASSMDYVTRRWRIAAGRFRFEVALIGAVFGTLLGLALLVQADHVTERNYLYSALSGVIPGMIIAMASLRRRLWRKSDSPFSRILSLARD